MRPVLRAAVVTGAVGVALFAATAASAHPLGNFTVNRAARLTIERGRLTIHYVIDMAEIPTVGEIAAADTDADGTVDGPERSAWAVAAASDVAEDVRVLVGDRLLTLVIEGAQMRLLPGQAGLRTLRLDAFLAAPLPPAGRLRFEDRSDPDKIGWREVTAVAGDGARLVRADVPARSSSRLLAAYPQDLLTSSPDVRAARVVFGPGAGVTAGEPAAPAGAAPQGGFTALVARRDLGALSVGHALLIAFAVGALHALGPGHGKAIMAGVLAGGGGKRRALRVAGAVALMHTASVLAVGLLVLAVEPLAAPERVYPWLGVVAGVAAILVGARIALGRLRRRAGHDHPHEHASRPGLVAIALAGGALPSPSAVVVFLGGLALHRAVFGLTLVAAFGIGLAATLSSVGALSARIGSRIRVSSGRPAAILPVAAGGMVVLSGAVLVARSALLV